MKILVTFNWLSTVPNAIINKQIYTNHTSRTSTFGSRSSAKHLDLQYGTVQVHRCWHFHSSNFSCYPCDVAGDSRTLLSVVFSHFHKPYISCPNTFADKTWKTTFNWLCPWTKRKCSCQPAVMPLSHNFDLLASHCLLLTSLRSIRNPDQHAQRDHPNTGQQNCNTKYYCPSHYVTRSWQFRKRQRLLPNDIFSMLVPRVPQVPTLVISEWCLLFRKLLQCQRCAAFITEQHSTINSIMNIIRVSFLEHFTFYFLFLASTEYFPRPLTRLEHGSFSLCDWTAVPCSVNLFLIKYFVPSPGLSRHSNPASTLWQKKNKNNNIKAIAEYIVTNCLPGELK